MNEPQRTAYEESTRLLSKTARTVGILVAVTVLFVGALSTAAVLVTSKAVGASSPAAAAESTSAATAAKKPLSI